MVNLASALLLSGVHHSGGPHHGHDHGQRREAGRGHDHAQNDHAHDHHRDGDRGRGRGTGATRWDNNLRSAYVHVLADALTSVLAIAALLGGRYASWVWLDPAMGIVGAAVITRWSWTLMRDSGAVLLDAADPALEAEVREHLGTSDDLRITDLHVWRVGPEAHAVIVSVTGSEAADNAAIRARLRPVRELAHLTVECR